MTKSQDTLDSSSGPQKASGNPRNINEIDDPVKRSLERLKNNYTALRDSKEGA